MSPSPPASELDRIRRERGLTVKQLASNAGCSTRTIQRAAQRRPGWPMSAFIAGALKTDPGEVWPTAAPLRETLGERARRLRGALGLSVTELARQLELSRRTVERLEFDSPTKPWVRRRVFEALGEPLPPRVVDYDAEPRPGGLASPEVLAAIADAAAPKLPRRQRALRGRPLEALVFALMEGSSYTSTRRAVRAYKAYVKAFGKDLGNWDPVELHRERSWDTIAVHGHGRKAHTIIEAAVQAQLSSAAVERLSVDSAISSLAGLPEVRRKLARRALYHAYGVPLHPADDAQLRVAKRLKLLDDVATPDDLAMLLSEFTAAGDGARVHAALQEVADSNCHVQWPVHDGCPLRDVCPLARP